MADIIWTVAHPDITGAERCRLSTATDGWHLTGKVVASFEGAPVDVEYEVEVDSRWLTRAVRIVVNSPTGRSRRELVRGQDGGWRADGEPRPHFGECTDVDLGISPSTNTLPIRRLGLDVGQVAEVRVVWVRFPDLRLEIGDQRYERVASHLWRYTSGSFSAELTVDDAGLVVAYGEDLWRQVVSFESPPQQVHPPRSEGRRGSSSSGG